MPSTVEISENLSLPIETVTQAVAILAKRRVGKSYLARKLAEGLHAAGQQLVILDPKGDWWGIRSSADGKSDGLPILIIGGEHGDIPLDPGAGETIAKLVVEETVSVLLDLSELRKHEIATFMPVFMEQLYRLKAREQYRTPLMVIADEADAIAPQKPQPNEARMLGAYDDLVRRGGQRGIGVTSITQRSAVLSKDVLTQSQILIALRMIAPQDLAAIKAWVDVHGTIEEQKTLMASLPSLPVGDAWVWSPGWPTDSGIFQRIHTLPIETFDSGATPKPGQQPSAPKRLADIDLEAVKRQMAETLERAKQNDPKTLHAEIKRLQKLVADGGGATINRAAASALVVRANQIKVQRMHTVSNLCAQLEEICRRTDLLLGIIRNEVSSAEQERLADDLEAFFKDLGASASTKPKTLPESIQPKPKETLAQKAERVRDSAKRAPVRKEPDESTGLPPGEEQCLRVISGRGERGATTALIVLHTGYRAGSIRSYTHRLITRGLVRRNQNIFYTTGAGDELCPSKPLPTGKKLLDHYEQSLPPGEVFVIRALRSTKAPLSIADLAASGSYTEGSLRSYTHRLITRGIIKRKSNRFSLVEDAK